MLESQKQVILEYGEYQYMNGYKNGIIIGISFGMTIMTLGIIIGQKFNYF